MQNAIAGVEDFVFAIEQPLNNQSTAWTMPFDGMDKSREEVCRLFRSTGSCPRGRLCPFRHTRAGKQVVCKHWLRSLCKKGDDCEFLHQYDPVKMPECHFFARFGTCNNHECLFQHIDPESKIKDCAWYARGFCKHGPNCANRHRKAVICPNYLCGFCPEGPECPLAHPRWELPASTTIDPETNKPDNSFSHRAGGATGQQSFGRPRGINVHGEASGSGGIICHKCGEPGHKAPQCPRNPRSEIVCHHCGTPGHRTPQCPQLRGTGGSRPLDQVLCFKCGQHGHYANVCPNPRAVVPGAPPMAAFKPTN